MGRAVATLRVDVRSVRAVAARISALEAALAEAGAALEWEWYGHAGGIADPCEAPPGSSERDAWREGILERCGRA